MNNLYLKYHGMPGVGVIGQAGDTGSNGHSVYFGFINNFFDCIEVKHDSKVKVAKRKADLYANYNELSKELFENIKKNNNNFPDSSLSYGLFELMANNSSIYYSGLLYDGDTKKLFGNTDVSNLLDYKFDIDNLPWMAAQMLSYIDNAAIIVDGSQFAETNIADIKIKLQGGQATFDYLDVYDYIDDISTGGYIPSTNISFDGVHVTYEPDDAAKELGISGGVIGQYLDSSLYTVLDSQADENLDSLSKDSLSYLREFIAGPQETNSFATDTADRYSIINQNGAVYKKELAYNATYIGTTELDTKSYTKNAFLITGQNGVFDDEFVISDNGNNLRYYGLTNSKLYNKDGKLNTKLEILKYVVNSSLFKNNDELYKSIDQYVERITMTLDANPLVGSSLDQDKIQIRWISDNSAKVYIPTYLKDTYKEGDIIYYYTDEQNFLSTNRITNMVIVTKDMELCGLDVFLASSIKTNPFEIKYLSSVEDRVTSYNKIITLALPAKLYEDITTDVSRFSYNSINNIISQNNDSALILANAYDEKNNQYANINAIKDGGPNNMVINVSSAIDNSSLNINAPIIKCDSLLVPNITYNGNVEAYRAIYDKNILLDSDKFLKSITGPDIYEYVLEDSVYLGTKLLASNYIKDGADLNNYIYGYELYNLYGELVQSLVSSKEELQMYISNLGPNNNLFDNTESNIKSYQILKNFSLDHIGGQSSSKLDWDDLTFTIKNTDNFKLINKYIYFIYDSGVVSKNSPFDKTNTIKILISLLSDGTYDYYTYASEAKDGKYYYDENGKTVKSLNAVYQNDVNIKSDVSIVTNIDIYSSYFYMVVFAANKNAGLKHFSKMSKIDYSLSISKNYLIDYECSIIGESVSLIPDTKSGNIEFKTTNISPEVNTNGLLYISSTNSDIQIKKVYINHNEVASNNAIIYENSWILVRLKNKEVYEYSFDISSNVPQVLNINDESSIEVQTINNYMISLADPSDGSKINEAPLFSKILKDQKHMTATTDRYILISVSYTIGESDEIYTEDYNLVLPGFKDTRDLPNIDISIHTDMEKIEKYNTAENGVLCNQFVTYMDINIDNFVSNWTKYIDNSTNVYMDLEISNIQADLDWTTKYQIQDIISRNTIKLIGDTVNNNGKVSTDIINNYVALNTTFVNLNNESVNYDFATISNNYKLQINSESLKLQDLSIFNIKDDNTGISKDYILCDTSIMIASDEPAKMYKGINDTISINMTNLTPAILTDCSTFRVKLEYEIGNPLISALYLRFAVTKVVIHYDTYINGENLKKTFTAKIPLYKIPGSTGYLYSYTSDNKEVYRNISNTLNVITNPVSYVFCPEENETEQYNIQGAVMKIGNDGKISKKLAFYQSEMYNSLKLINLDKSAIRMQLLYDWIPSRLKAAYFLDNISNIDVSFISMVTPDKVKQFMIDQLDPNLKAGSNANYLNIFYNADIMNPKLREDVYTFYYNNKELPKARFNLINRKLPVYTDDSVTLEIRNKKLIDSMDIWNFEYLNSSKTNSDKTFVGNINLYGNGYMYLNNSIDINQYNGSETYSLKDTKKLNDLYIFGSTIYDDFTHKANDTAEPESKTYYRSFLYNIDLTYTYNGVPYQIVSDFDYLIKYAIANGINIPNRYKEKLEYLTNLKYAEKNANMVPYSLLFDITPRIACNKENDTINVLMLRKPSIGNDTDNASDYKNYELQKHYFELSDPNSFIKLPVKHN